MRFVLWGICCQDALEGRTPLPTGTKNKISTWQLWAFLASAFAALTALLAKVRVTGIDSNLTTFMRTLVVAACLKP
jgi:hypothetical protein